MEDSTSGPGASHDCERRDVGWYAGRAMPWIAATPRAGTSTRNWRATATSGWFPDRYYGFPHVEPDSFDDPHEHSLRIFRNRVKHRGKQAFPVAPFSPTEAQWRHAAAAEYGMISMIDEGIGRILGRLDELGLRDDTIVVFTADHGDMFGDHGMMLKGGMHYEGCVRVPLLVATPGRSPAVTDSLAGSLDIAQTLLELAGIPAYHGMQGESLVPVLDDPANRVRDSIVIEEDELFDMAGVGEHLRMRTLVTEDARLTLYQGAEQGELFDLENDPGELSNRFAEPTARERRAELTEQLARRMMAYADRAPKPTFFA